MRQSGIAARVMGISAAALMATLVAQEPPTTAQVPLVVPRKEILPRLQKPAQGSTPRTPWGDPDLEGVWSSATRTPFERPTQYAGRALLTDAEVAEIEARTADRGERAPRDGDTGTYNQFWWEDGKVSNRTSLIVDPPDGRLPLTELGRRTAGWERGTDSWEDRTLWERCLTRGLPNSMIPGFYLNNYQILQTPESVVIVYEMIHDARIIPLDGRPHLSPNAHQWMGDSRGHWEGDTLVVDVTNFTNKTLGRLHPAGAYLGSGEALHLVERFTRVDGNTIDYEFTVNDPVLFTRPWTAAYPLNKEKGLIYEYACHEANRGMENILSGARAEEARADGATRP